MPEELEAPAVWNVEAKRLIGGFALRCNKAALPDFALRKLQIKRICAKRGRAEF